MKPHLRGCRTQEVEEQRSKLWPDRETKYNVNDVSSQNAYKCFMFQATLWFTIWSVSCPDIFFSSGSGGFLENKKNCI